MPRVMEIVTPLGEDLLFHAMHGREELGRIAEFQVDLLSPKKAINVDDILGKNVTIKLVQPRSTTTALRPLLQRDRLPGLAGRHARALLQVLRDGRGRGCGC